MDASNQIHPVRRFGTDGWSVLASNPIEELLTNDEDWDVGLRRLGWEEFSRTGRATQDPSGIGSPFHLLVLHQPHSLEDPQFLIELSGNLGDSVEHVFVQDLPSLFALLAAWAPVLQSTAMTNLAAALPTDPDELAGLLGSALRSRSPY